MNTKLQITVYLICICTINPCESASVIIDDFTSGSYAISNNTPTSDLSPITSVVSNNRWSRGSGSINWASSVDNSLGILTYTLTLPRSDAPSPTTGLSITYSNSESNLNLAGFDAFFVNVSNVIGTGVIYAFEGPSRSLDDLIPVAFAGAGQLYIPFANMDAVNTVDPNSITFRIVPQSADFSVSLTSITLVPEPSVAFLLVLGASSLLLRRRPQNR